MLIIQSRRSARIAAAAADVLDGDSPATPTCRARPGLLPAQFAPADSAGELRVEGGVAVLAFGNYSGVSLNGVAAADPGYLDWVPGRDFAPDIKAAVRVPSANAVGPSDGR